MAGVKAELFKAAFKQAFKKGPKMYRHEVEYSYKPLKNTHFDKSRVLEGGGGMGPKGEPGGIFFTEHPLDINSISVGLGKNRKRALEDLKESNKKWPFLKTSPFNITAVPLPKSRLKEFTAEEWIKKGYSKKPLKELTEELSKKYDFVKFPDIAANHPEMNQWVQLNPKKALARLNTGDKLSERTYKILGATGLAAGSTLLPDESEASPIGKIQTGLKAYKNLRSPISSTNKQLTGRTLEGELIKGLKTEGKTIRSVTQGKGSWRSINFDDGTSLPITKDILHSIMREVGTREKMAEFSIKQTSQKLKQARKSLQYHLNYKPMPKKDTKDLRVKQLKQVKETFEQPEEPIVGVWHKKRYLTMPEEYAKILESVGDIKIDRSQTGVIK